MIMASPEVRYLLSLGAIRKQAKIVGDAARLDKLNHFDLHDEQFEEVVDYVHASMEVSSSTILIILRAPDTRTSEILDLISITRFPCTAAGSTLMLGTCLALQGCYNNGKQQGPTKLKLRGA